VLGASTGMFGAVWAQAELRRVLARMGASVVDVEVPVPEADEQFDGTGQLALPELRAQVAALLEQLYERAGQPLHEAA